MPIKNWLLTGTSLTMLMLAPLSAATAQDATDPALVKAYAAFQADQSDANRDALNQACIAAGFQSLDDCIAAITGQRPVEETASSAEAQPSSEAAPPAEASSEAPPPPSAEAPPPASSEAAPQPAPAPSEAAPPAKDVSSEQPSSAEQPASAPAEPAAPTSSEPATPASSAVPADTSSAPSADTTDILGQLTAAVDAYNAAAAEVDAGNGDARVKADAARAQIDAICTGAGFTDTTACLAQFGLSIAPLPPAPDASASAPAADTSSSAAPASDMPQASEPVDQNAVEVLPPDVSSEAAPILDSAKDQQNASSAPSSAEPVAPDASSSSAEQPQQPAAPVEPPKTDADAQASLQPLPDQQAVITEEGKPKSPDFVFVQPPPPSDVQVVDQPKQDKGGIVFKIGINIYINNQAQTRDRIYDRDRGDQIYYEDLSKGRVRETIERKDGTKIVTIYDRYGDVLQRSKVLRDGRTIILAAYDPRDEQDLGQWRDPGDELPPLVLHIPANQYILDADTADESQVEDFLSRPPVEQVRRIYSIDEVKRSARLRDSVRRLEIGDLTFQTGKATIDRNQVGSLATVAKAIQKLLDRNPAEVFLIEGHTDAVGSDVSNLVLSDERANTVARILTDFYDIPAENLVTQGYGERYLKVKTDGPEALNRRVTVKRITPLVTYETAQN